MEKFVLIDGNAILHRAFHALPLLTSKNGEVVNAVYGFFSMFLKILEDQKPKYVAVCFDRAAPTFRQELYVGYQAQRPKTADDLVPQIGLVHEVLEKANISIFELDGYEADDLIGTLAAQAVRKTEDRTQKTDSRKTEETEKSQNQSSVESVQSAIRPPSSVVSPLEIIIVSGDRDLLQLVNSYVKVIAPVTGLTNMIVYDSVKVEEKFGIKPSQIVDYKALVGDSSDNYPGVSGIGPKTASSLLKEYGSFENMYKNIDSLPPKIAEKLATDAEQAALAKKLATIVTDAPIKLNLEDCSFASANLEGLKKEFERLDFKSLMKRLMTDDSKGMKKTRETEGKKDNGQMKLLA